MNIKLKQHCYILTPSLPHILTPSLPHFLTSSHPHSLTSSLPHFLSPSPPHFLTPSSLTPSLPHPLTPSLPHPLTPSLPHPLTPRSSFPRKASLKDIQASACSASLRNIWISRFCSNSSFLCSQISLSSWWLASRCDILSRIWIDVRLCTGI